MHSVFVECIAYNFGYTEVIFQTEIGFIARIGNPFHEIYNY